MARKSRKNQDVIISDTLENTMLRTVMYLRLSKEDIKEENTSIDNQRNIIRSFIDSNSDLQLVGEYVDNGLSGTNFERASFKEMIDKIERKEIDCIVVKDLSRFGRNVIDTGYYIEKFLPIYNVRFIAVNDNFDSIENINGDIILPLKNIINESYAKDISKKIKAQKKSLMLRGEYCGNFVPYGYIRIRDEDNKSKFIVDEETAIIVREIYELALNGFSPQYITRKLNDDLVLTPAQSKEKQGAIKNEKILGNGKWNLTMVKRILSSEAYIGSLVQGKRKSINGKEVKVPKEEWIVIKNSHKAIVEEKVFNDVQEIISKRSKKYDEYNLVPYEENYFRGKMFCGCCNSTLNVNKTKGFYNYYCRTRYTVDKNMCVGLNVSKHILLDKIYEELELKYKNFVDNSFLTNLDSEINNYDVEIKKLRSELNANKKYIKSLYENLVKNIISEDEYLDLKRFYEENNSKISQKINTLELQNRKNKKNIKAISTLNNELRCQDKIDEKTLSSFIKSVVVHKDKSVDIEFIFEEEVQ